MSSLFADIRTFLQRVPYGSVSSVPRQLERPGCFAEKIVAVDGRFDGFNRQYDDANPAARLAPMERLLADGIVDR